TRAAACRPPGPATTVGGAARLEPPDPEATIQEAGSVADSRAVALAVPRPGHRRGGRAGRDRRRPGAGDPGRRLPAGDLPLAAPGGAAAMVLARPAGRDPAGRGAPRAVAACPAAPLGLGDPRRPRLRGRARRLQRSPGAGAGGRG